MDECALRNSFNHHSYTFGYLIALVLLKQTNSDNKTNLNEHFEVTEIYDNSYDEDDDDDDS